MLVCLVDGLDAFCFGAFSALGLRVSLLDFIWPLAMAGSFRHMRWFGGEGAPGRRACRPGFGASRRNRAGILSGGCGMPGAQAAFRGPGDRAKTNPRAMAQTMIALASASLGLVAALAWNEAIKEIGRAHV